MYLNFLLLPLLLISSALLSMDMNDMLEISKDNARMSEETRRAQRRHDNPKPRAWIRQQVDLSLANHSHPFSTTSIIRFTGNEFILKGDILDLTETDIADVNSGNFVYTDNYDIVKTRLSGPHMVAVGAIILGTRDRLIKRQFDYAMCRHDAPLRMRFSSDKFGDDDRILFFRQMFSIRRDQNFQS